MPASSSKTSPKKDYYTLLDIPRDANDQTIREAYLKQANKHHQERLGGDSLDFKAIKEAYDCLKSPLERARYDRENPQTSNKDDNIAAAASSSQPTPKRPENLRELTERVLNSLAQKLRHSNIPNEEKRKFSNLLGILEKYKTIKTATQHDFFYKNFFDRLNTIGLSEENKELRNAFKRQGIGPICAFIDSNCLPEGNPTNLYKQALSELNPGNASNNIIIRLTQYIKRAQANTDFSFFGESRSESRKMNVMLANRLKSLFKEHENRPETSLTDIIRKNSNGKNNSIEELLDVHVKAVRQHQNTNNYSIRSTELNLIISDIRNYETKHELDDNHRARTSLSR